MAAPITFPTSLTRAALARPHLSAAMASALLGALAACGFQPLALWPLTVVALALFIEMLSRAARRGQAFLAGWLFGVGHFAVGNFWIATAFTYQADMPAWLGGVAVFGLALYLALFPALAALAGWSLVRRLAARQPPAMPWLGLAFAAYWIVTEWMRGWVFTGFAWNPLSAALLGPYDTPGLAMLAPWTGTYGLSGVLVLIAAGLRRLVWAGLAGDPRQRAALAFGGVTLAVLLAAWMTTPATWLERREGGREFTLVQPDIRQEHVNDSRYYEANFLKLARQSTPRVPSTQRMVFWPESGLADYLRDGYPRYLYQAMNYGGDPVLARQRIGRVIGPYSLLMIGAVDLVIVDGDDVAARNSVTTLDANGNLLASYAKAHLVPGGEYLPLRWLLEPIGLRRLVAGTLDFWPGPGPRTFDFGPWGRAGVQICYEIVFSGEVVDPRVQPDFIFNPSNDGWFGAWGPPQHLAQARLRAIEEGLPVLRSTTNGISAVIDANGLVRASIERHKEGRIDGRIPPPAPPTLFARLGNALPLGLALVLIAACAVALWRGRARDAAT
ncbi:MAG: apolipoprotein N-acyltransferase [Alphaproteobacteria bacterium]|nr:apolipoprotein N-acyltransferase [Alphaproteobacteria bacterium]